MVFMEEEILVGRGDERLSVLKTETLIRDLPRGDLLLLVILLITYRLVIG